MLYQLLGIALKVEIKKIKKIIERRIITAPIDFQDSFPDVFKGKVQWFSYSNDKVFLLVFLDSIEMERILEHSIKKYDPFPGLITFEPSVNAAIRIMADSKNNFFTGCTVSEMYSFSIGQDATFIIQDHSQILQTKEIGEINYKVPLAYIISFGENIQKENVYQSLDELIAYSIKVWREKDEPFI